MKANFQNVVPPNEWICLADTGLHAFDDTAWNRWPVDFYRYLLEITTTHRFCFVFVGSELDFNIASAKLKEIGQVSFPWIYSYDEPTNTKSFIEFGQGVLSNNGTLHRYALSLGKPVAVVQSSFIDRCETEATKFNLDDRQQMLEWLNSLRNEKRPFSLV